MSMMLLGMAFWNEMTLEQRKLLVMGSNMGLRRGKSPRDEQARKLLRMS